VQALQPKPDGTYLDCTGGGGGHTQEILAQTNGNAAVYVFDRDPEAAAHLQVKFKSTPNVHVIHGNFYAAQTLLEPFGIDGFNGILLDLGVSSVQLDTAERGFSFHQDGALDMRMSPEAISAAVVVNTLPEDKLKDIFWRLGQEKYASAIARAICRARRKEPIETTLQLAEIISSAVPAAARRAGHPARKTFMALRYYVNSEIDGLESALQRLFALLKVFGCMSIISFNSLEDSVVKKAFAPLLAGCICPPEFPECRCGRTPQARRIQKSISPSEAEIKQNPRARSAKLRAIQKIYVSNQNLEEG
jgi:16S rRNA (cytosine1402-N4)-methyltransferase